MIQRQHSSIVKKIKVVDYVRIDQKINVAFFISMRPQIFFDEGPAISIREIVMASRIFEEGQTSANDCSRRVQQNLLPTFLEVRPTLVSNFFFFLIKLRKQCFCVFFNFFKKTMESLKSIKICHWSNHDPTIDLDHMKKNKSDGLP